MQNNLKINTMPDDTPITAEHMKKWNKLISYAKSKGYSGKAELDHDENLRKKVFNEFNKANPKDAIPYELVKPIQNEIQSYKKKTLEDAKVGRVILGEGVTPDNFMKDISQIDGIFGQKTSSWKFPEAYVLNKETGEKRSVGFAPKVDLKKVLSSAKTIDEFFKK